jgi:hypothetical protein
MQQIIFKKEVIMARRAGRRGDHLLTDDYSGMTIFASQAQRDYWGALTKHPLKRNLQEISSPLNDPQPVSDFRGPNYEAWPYAAFGFIVPIDVGLTSVLTNRNNAAIQALAENPTTARGIGGMQIGSTFQVS